MKIIPLLIKSYSEYSQQYFDLKSWRRNKTLCGVTSGDDTQPASSDRSLGNTHWDVPNDKSRKLDIFTQTALD